MNNTLATIISSRGRYYYRAAELKQEFMISLSRNQPDCSSKFESFFTELSEKFHSLNENPGDLEGMCTYIICEILGIMIAMGIKEKDINSLMLADFYELDHARDNREKLDALKKTCVNMIEIARKARMEKNYSKVITQSMQYVEEHIDEKITLQNLCKEINYSTSHLSHQFRMESGISFGEYVRVRKMEKARTLLLKDMTIDSVASALSFSSASHFINAFKKTYNITPKQFVKWMGKYGNVKLQNS